MACNLVGHPLSAHPRARRTLTLRNVAVSVLRLVSIQLLESAHSLRFISWYNSDCGVRELGFGGTRAPSRAPSRAAPRATLVVLAPVSLAGSMLVMEMIDRTTVVRPNVSPNESSETRMDASHGARAQ